MDLSKKHYLQLLICLLICVICGVLFAYYYKEYVAPESFTIGSITTGTYKELAIKDYLSDEEVLFSQNINDVSFNVIDGVATYEYIFEQTDYNGLTNDYALFINDELVSDSQNAGTFSADYVLNFRDVDNEIINTTIINIDFTFENAGSTLRVTFNDENDSLALLMNYFKQNNFILTLCNNPFVFDNIEGLDDNIQDDSTEYALVTFKDGEDTTVKLLEKGSNIDLLENTKSNFLGWTLDNSIINDDYIVNSNITLIALYYDYYYLDEQSLIVDDEVINDNIFALSIANCPYDTIDFSKSYFGIGLKYSTDILALSGILALFRLDLSQFGSEIIITNITSPNGRLESVGSCSLIFNEDGSIIYNPGDFQIFIDSEITTNYELVIHYGRLYYTYN